MVARSHMYKGIGYSLLESDVKLRERQREHQRHALQAFRRYVLVRFIVTMLIDRLSVTGDYGYWCRCWQCCYG